MALPLHPPIVFVYIQPAVTKARGSETVCLCPSFLPTTILSDPSWPRASLQGSSALANLTATPREKQGTFSCTKPATPAWKVLPWVWPSAAEERHPVKSRILLETRDAKQWAVLHSQVPSKSQAHVPSWRAQCRFAEVRGATAGQKVGLPAGTQGWLFYKTSQKISTLSSGKEGNKIQNNSRHSSADGNLFKNENH